MVAVLLGTEIKFTERNFGIEYCSSLYFQETVKYSDVFMNKKRKIFKETADRPGKKRGEMFVFCVFGSEKFCSFSSATGP